MTHEGVPNLSEVYRPEEEFSREGALDVEEAIRKGQEIKDALAKILDEVKFMGLLETGAQIEIEIDRNISLLVIPRFPIEVRPRGKVSPFNPETTTEPTMVEDVRVDAILDENEVPALLVSGGISRQEESEVRLDPFAGHDILAYQENSPGTVRQDGKTSLSSKNIKGIYVLQFKIS